MRDAFLEESRVRRCQRSLIAPHRNDSTRSRLDHSDVLIFTSGGEQRAISIPSNRLNGVRMAAIDLNGFRSLDVPQHDLMVESGAQDQILRRRVPLDVVDASLMSVQIDFPLVGVGFQSVVGDVPNLDGSVVGARRDLIIVERIEFQVNDWPAVAGDTWMIDVDTTSLDQILIRSQRARARAEQTSVSRRTRKLPPPDVSVTMARNLAFTAQKLPSCALRVMAMFL